MNFFIHCEACGELFLSGTLHKCKTNELFKTTFTLVRRVKRIF